MSKILFINYCAKDFIDGCQNMDAITELAYRRICDLIYSTNDNLLDDDDALIYSTKTGNKWKAIKKSLIEVHKKIYVHDGKIRNVVCTKKLAESLVNIEQKRQAGKASVRARNPLNNNKTVPTAVTTSVPTGDTTSEPTNHQPPTENQFKTPSSFTQSAREGVLKNGNGKGFHVEHLLTDGGLASARENAPGWDIHYLMRVYDSGVHSGEREPPNNANKAFPAWCKSYTKGKQP